jgi:hypothetical protein
LQSEISKWECYWNSILDSRGATRYWIITDLNAKQKALDHIIRHVATTLTTTKVDSIVTTDDAKDEISSLNILCPLAGNDLFVKYAWTQGHSVTAIDLLPQAVTSMRKHFSGDDDDDDTDWTRKDYAVTTTNSESKEVENGGMVCCWQHKSGRVTLYQGDITTSIPELHGTFDAIYDKDSFGAIPPSIRSAFCSRMSEYLKAGGILYSEVKFKSDDNPDRHTGPPYHLEKDDFMKDEHFGSTFDYVAELGEVYELQRPGAKQMGHILKRTTSKKV